MNSNIDKTRLLEVLPSLRFASAEVKEEFFEHGIATKLDRGATVGNEGDRCANLALVLTGRVRVFKISENGREIALYRINQGETCILTASCLLAQVNFPAYAVTETPVEAVAIPAHIFRRWVIEYPFWQEFVFKLLSKRLAAIISVVEEVAFRRVDSRIATYLLSGKKAIIQKTHYQIATEIGTSREVVSRILKDFEHKGIVSLSRGAVQIDKAPQLRQISEII